MSDATAFSPDYTTARARFRGAAHALGLELRPLLLSHRGPDGDELTVDIAVLGSSQPKRAVVVSSGLHGVEGFFGSAVQAALLEDVLGGWQPADGTAVVLLHALNPFGFAWLRRVNEDNIDLNRNFLLPDQDYSGSPEGYADLDGMLNPPRPPARVSLFLPQALLNIARHGMPTLKNAVAGGQYDFPRGLFFGGAAPSATRYLLGEHLPPLLGGCERVLHVDFHTGLGRHGTYKLFVDHPWGSDGAAGLGAIFGEDVVEPWEPEKGTSYAIRGGLGTWCKHALGPSYDVLAAEFGTVHVLKVISALHLENRSWQWGNRTSEEHQRHAEALRDVFAPPERRWRDAVVGKGLKIVQQALEAVC